ncbi:MAG TPA: response regulator [Gammaproteobacteria bacterium]|nr:response regulator [Gammaproteobacteria bacterium]
MSEAAGELAGITVLVADDSETIRYATQSLLERKGARVLTAVDGFEALAAIADGRPDLVFADVMMPRIDGYQLCALVKANAVFRSIPVVMLSAREGAFEAARSRMAGSEEHLGKPFTEDELAAVVARHVSPRSAAAH